MKKLTSLFLALLLVASLTVCASAASEKISVYLDGFNGADGEKISFDVPPQTINNRTMVPIRAIFEAMGATVTWDDNTQTAVCTKDGTTVKMTVNNTTEYINDVAHEMDVTPVVIDGRTLAPARYVAEAFGYHVAWDEMTQSVLISKNEKYSISDVVDGSRAHPYKLGSTISFKFFSYDDESGVCTFTLKSFLSPDEVKEKYSKNLYFAEDNWYVSGHIKLDEFSGEGSCGKFDVFYNAEGVTSKMKKMGDYSWYSSLSPLSYGFELYSGGETDCFIPIKSDVLTEGETADYFTITYRSGTGYDDKKTIWFSLK